MKIWRLVLVSVLFTANLKPVLNDLEIVVSLPSPAKPSLNKTLYCFGDEHANLCSEEENQEQIDSFSNMFTQAKNSGKQTYHTLIEATKLLFKDSLPNVLGDLMSLAQSKGFENIDDIEIRSKTTAARSILKSNAPERMREKLQEEGSFARQAKQSFPHFCLQDLTFKDILEEHTKFVQQAHERIDSIKDPAAKKVYIDDLQALEEKKEHSLNWCYREGLRDDDNIFDVSIRLYRSGDPKDNRRLLPWGIYELTADLFDLNLFYQILMLEDKPVEKVIIVSHRVHIEALIKKLERTGRYRSLEHFTSPDLSYTRGQITMYLNVPLQISLFSLVEAPREKLEWEVQIKRLSNFFYLMYKRSLMKLLLI